MLRRDKKKRIKTQQNNLPVFCSQSCRISVRDCTKNTRPELLTPADPNPPQLTSSAHAQCLATSAFYWLKFGHPPTPLLSYSTGQPRNLKSATLARTTQTHWPSIRDVVVRRHGQQSCQSIYYDHNPKRSFGSFADSDKRWLDLLLHTAQEPSGVHYRQFAYKLLEPFALLEIPQGAHLSV